MFQDVWSKQMKLFLDSTCFNPPWVWQTGFCYSMWNACFPQVFSPRNLKKSVAFLGGVPIEVQGKGHLLTPAKVPKLLQLSRVAFGWHKDKENCLTHRIFDLIAYFLWYVVLLWRLFVSYWFMIDRLTTALVNSRGIISSLKKKEAPWPSGNVMKPPRR